MIFDVGRNTATKLKKVVSIKFNEMSIDKPRYHLLDKNKKDYFLYYVNNDAPYEEKHNSGRNEHYDFLRPRF